MSTHHHNNLAGKHIAVVGGGLAGLAAAKVLADGGASLEVIELSDRVGGRVASDVIDGFTVDHGFQVGPLETGRELGGLFMVGAACQMGVGRVLGLVTLLFAFFC
jgi:predicted NAD/FAD-dependent oxidoreductase